MKYRLRIFDLEGSNRIFDLLSPSRLAANMTLWSVALAKKACSQQGVHLKTLKHAIKHFLYIYTYIYMYITIGDIYSIGTNQFVTGQVNGDNHPFMSRRLCNYDMGYTCVAAGYTLVYRFSICQTACIYLRHNRRCKHYRSKFDILKAKVHRIYKDKGARSGARPFI